MSLTSKFLLDCFKQKQARTDQKQPIGIDRGRPIGGTLRSSQNPYQKQLPLATTELESKQHHKLESDLQQQNVLNTVVVVVVVVVVLVVDYNLLICIRNLNPNCKILVMNSGVLYWQ